jgi:serine/threonine protein kinase/predicted Zn-dependent protease
LISETISHYRILDPLGAGGMGEVYLAEDTRLGRRVALKILPASYQYDQDRRARFLNEARAASALRSPHIAAIYDIGEHEGAQFIAMEYVEGQLLSRRIEQGPLSAFDAIEIALQVADALEEAHSLGLVHRDIKSSNLMITSRRLVKVLDFGLVKLIAARPSDPDHTLQFGIETSPGMVMGTVAYMSPEQARGLDIDARTDIFSLGVVLYEMVAGRRPFEGATTSDLIVSILEREPLPLSRHSAQLPSQLDWIISKSLRKNRDERYQSVRDLGIDLKNLLRALDLEARQSRTADLYPSSGAREAATQLMTPAQEDSSSGAARRRRSRKAIDSIAILPLVNAGQDAQAEYLSDGITESIINNLSRQPRLRVMARSTVFRFKGRDADAQRVGAELGVRAVLTGSLRQIGGNLIIGTELVDVEDGSQLWGEQYNRRMSDIFALQEEISKEIIENLRLKLGVREKRRLARQHTGNAEAYDLYLKGRYHANRWSEESLLKSIEFFDQALEHDPAFALAYAGLSDAYGTLWFFNYLPPEATIPQAERAALRALSLDDSLAEVHLSLANMKFYYEWDWEGAESEYHRAIELNPNFANAHHMLSFYYASLGRTQESVAAIERAVALDPLSVMMNCGMSMACYYAGRWDEALTWINKSLEMDPTFLLARRQLAHVYDRMGRHQEAAQELIRLLTYQSGSLDARTSLEEAFSQGGMREFWRQWAEIASRLGPRIVTPFFIASAYASADDTEKAFLWLEKAFQERSGYLVYIDVEARFDPLRSDPRFAHLLRRMRHPHQPA